MKKLRIRAILKAMGYKENKTHKYWASDEHILFYGSIPLTSEELLKEVKELHREDCPECDGHMVDDNGEQCKVCSGKGSVYHL